MKELERRLTEGSRLSASRRHIMLNVFEILFALLLIPSSLGWITKPSSFAPSILTQATHVNSVRVMGLMLFLGSLSVIAGVVGVLPRIERIGLSLWGPTITLYTFIILTAPPSSNSSTSQRVFAIGIYGAFAVACLVRYIYLGELIKIIHKRRGGDGN